MLPRPKSAQELAQQIQHILDTEKLEEWLRGFFEWYKTKAEEMWNSQFRAAKPPPSGDPANQHRESSRRPKGKRRRSPPEGDRGVA